MAESHSTQKHQITANDNEPYLKLSLKKIKLISAKFTFEDSIDRSIKTDASALMAVGFGKFQYTPLQWIYPACEECEYTHTTSDKKAIHIEILYSNYSK